MFNPETNSQHEILVAQQNLKLPYDEMLTDATLVLAAMQRHDVRAFEAALKFPFISESMTYVERYNKMYAFCKGWIKPKRKVESDDYASASEWRSFFEWRQIGSRRESELGHSQPTFITSLIAGDRDTIGCWVDQLYL